MAKPEGYGLLDHFFPLPQFTKEGAECAISGPPADVAVTDETHVLKDPPWSATLDHAALGTIVHAKLGGRAGCAGGMAQVSFVGSPSSEVFHAWLLAAEREHGADHACLVSKYLEGYDRDVAALPARFPAGYMGWGDCATRLEERLQRAQRYNAMIGEREAMRLSHDWPASPGRSAGPHHPRMAVASDPQCATITVTIFGESMSPWSGSCDPWSPGTPP